MTTSTTGVVVGVDSSACSHEALGWAARDAAARGRRLTVATVVDLPRLADVPISPQFLVEQQQAAEQTVAAAVSRAGPPAPGVTVEATVRTGDPAVELIRLAAAADEIVVGSRGHSQLGGLLLGSVGANVAEHASCPVVVVRGRENAHGPVVVGIDGSERAEAALDFGFGYADRHRLPLVALHVYTLGAFFYPAMPYPVPPFPISEELDRVRSEATRTAEESLGRWTAKYPDVSARAEVAEGPAAHHLVEASGNASLLVVGTRGHGGLAGMLLGSVSQAVTRHAACPVAIAR